LNVNATLGLQRANVKIHVSTLKTEYPKWADNTKPLRMLKIKGLGNFEFSEGFNKLHFDLYEKIISGEWDIDLRNLESLISICTADRFY
jgi:hypothetical protein